MASRNTGNFHPPEQVVVITCDVCQRDIGHEDGRRPNEHFRITRHPNPGAIDNQAPAVLVCSSECMRSFAASSQMHRPAG
jgi:hypothetical protein